MKQRTLNIWGDEVEAIRAKSVEVVKQKYPISGYDKSQMLAERARANAEKRKAKA